MTAAWGYLFRAPVQSNKNDNPRGTVLLRVDKRGQDGGLSYPPDGQCCWVVLTTLRIIIWQDAKRATLNHVRQNPHGFELLLSCLNRLGMRATKWLNYDLAWDQNHVHFDQGTFAVRDPSAPPAKETLPYRIHFGSRLEYFFIDFLDPETVQDESGKNNFAVQEFGAFCCTLNASCQII